MRRRLWLGVLALSLTSACAARGPSRPQPFPQPGGTPAAADPRAEAVAGRLGDSVAHAAVRFVGTPYRRGGDTPGGFDCSGLVHYVFGLHGIGVPRSVAELQQAGARVTRRDLRPGDLVFFATAGPKISHVGIVIGDEQFVHAPSRRGTVRVEPLTSPYWARRYVTSRRIAGPV
jgi:cell wall-associated NlpC family hydrolase